MSFSNNKKAGKKVSTSGSIIIHNQHRAGGGRVGSTRLPTSRHAGPGLSPELQIEKMEFDVVISSMWSFGGMARCTFQLRQAWSSFTSIGPQ